MVFTFCLLLIGTLPLISIAKKDRGSGDIFSVFYDVPEVDTVVVPVYRKLSRNKRSPNDKHELHFSAFGKNFSLYFEPEDHVLFGTNTPIIKATGNATGKYINYENYDHIKSELNFRPLVDKENNAVAVEYQTDDKVVQLEGIVRDEYVFSTQRNRANFDEIRIYQIPLSKKENQENAFNETISYLNVQTRREAIKQIKIDSYVPETVYPEILVVVDDMMYKHYGGNVPNIIKYVLGFWTSVDLRYREMKSPKVRLNIAGVIIATNQSAIPFMVAHDKFLYAVFTIKSMVYDTSIPRIPNLPYDILMLMTRRMLFGTTHNNRWISINGVANVGSACGKYNYEVTNKLNQSTRIVQQTASVGVIRDYGLYTGSFAAAHELAHMLGVEHDGLESERQHSTNCQEHAGYLMNAGNNVPEAGINRLFFSECSKLAMRAFLNFGHSECLHNKPNVGRPVYKPIPGATLTLLDQCRESYGTKSRLTESGMRPCEMLHCFVYNNTTKHWSVKSTNRPAAEGTPCEEGTDKICLNGKCDFAPQETRDKHFRINNYVMPS